MSRDVASVTIVGRAGTHPQVSGSTGERVSFRVVATERRFDRAADEWVDGDEFGVAVVCWRAMGTSVLTTIRRGDPVVVVGRIVTRRFEKNGATQYFTEVKADCVGLDVSRVGTRFTRNRDDPRTAGDDQSGSTGAPDGGAAGTTGDVAADGKPAPASPADDLVEPDDGDDPWASGPGRQNGHAPELISVD